MLLNKKNILFFILVGLVISYSASVPRERDITVMPIVPICDEGKTGGCATPPIYETLIMMEINSTEPNSIMANMLVIGVNRFNVSDRISMNNVPIYYFAVCSDNKKIIRNSITDPDGILTVNITDFMKTCSDCSIVVFRYCPVVHTEQGLRGCLAINESLAYYGLSTMNELYSRENNTIDSQTYSYCESTKGDVDRTTCLLITLMFAFLGGAMYLAGGSPFRMVGFTRTKMPKTRMYQMRPKSMSFTMMGISSLGGKLVSGALKKVGKGKGGGEESESGNDEGSEGTGGNPEQDANFVGPPEAPSKAPPKMFRADSKMSKAMAKVRGGYVKVVNFATKPTQTLGKAMGKIPIVGGLGIREEKGGQQVKDPRLASMGVSGGGSSALDSIANPKQISGTNFGEIFSSVASTIMGQLYQGMLNHYTGGLGGYAFQGLEKLGSKKQWTGFLKVLRVVQNPVGTLDNWVQNRNVVRMKKKLDKTLDGMQEGGTFTQQDKENKEKTNSRIEGLLADKIKIENIDPTTGHTSINIDGKKFVLDSRDIGSLGSGDFGVIGQHIASGLQTAQHMAILLYRGSFWNALENFRKDYANAKSEKEKEMITGKFELFLKTNGIDAYDPGQMSFGENLKNFVTGKSGPKTVGELRKNIARTYNGMLGNIGTAFVSMSLDLKAAEQMRLYGGVMPEEAMEMLSLGDEYQNIKKKLDTQLEKIKDLEREAAEAKANGDDELSDTLLRKASEKREKLFSWVEKQIEIKVEKIEKLQIKEGGFGRTVRDESISRENKGGEEEPGASESYAIKRFNETREEILELKLGILCLVSVRAGNELPDSLDSLLIPHLINVDMYSMLYREKEALMMGTVYLSNSYDIYAQGMINEEFNAYKFSTATTLTQLTSLSDPTKNLTLEQNIILGIMASKSSEESWYSQMIENQTERYQHVYNELQMALGGLNVLGEMNSENGSLWIDGFSGLSNALKTDLVDFDVASSTYENKSEIETETQQYKDVMIECDVIDGVMDNVDKTSNRQNYVNDYHNKENIMINNQTQFVGLYGTEDQQTSYNELEGNLTDLRGRLGETTDPGERATLITEIVETKTEMENVGRSVGETIENERNSNITHVNEQFEEEIKRNDGEARKLANDEAELREKMMERDALFVQRYEAQVENKDTSSIDARILDVTGDILEIVPENKQESMQESLDRRDNIYLTYKSDSERISEDFGPRLNERDSYLSSQNEYEQSRAEFANKVFVSGSDYDRFEGIRQHRHRDLEDAQTRISSIIKTPEGIDYVETNYQNSHIDMMSAIASTSDRIADRVGKVFRGNDNLESNKSIVTDMLDRFDAYKEEGSYEEMKTVSQDVLKSNAFVKNLISVDYTIETINTQVFWKKPKKTDNRYNEFKQSISENFGDFVGTKPIEGGTGRDKQEPSEVEIKREQLKNKISNILPELKNSISNTDRPWREANRILDKSRRAFEASKNSDEK